MVKKKSRIFDRKKERDYWKKTLLFATVVGFTVALFMLFFTRTAEIWLANWLHPDVAFFASEFFKYFLLTIFISLVVFYISRRNRDDPPMVI
jgi:Na+-driven multidrug efflux pump